MAVNVRGLDSRDERVRQSVATELIEWELGRATQRTEVTANMVQFTPETVVEGERLRAEFCRVGRRGSGRYLATVA